MSHPEKAASDEPKALKETNLPMRRKIILTISHTQHWIPPIPTPISTKEKECGREKKKADPHREQEKVNQGKNQEES